MSPPPSWTTGRGSGSWRRSGACGPGAPASWSPPTTRRWSAWPTGYSGSTTATSSRRWRDGRAWRALVTDPRRAPSRRAAVAGDRGAAPIHDRRSGRGRRRLQALSARRRAGARATEGRLRPLPWRTGRAGGAVGVGQELAARGTVRLGPARRGQAGVVDRVRRWRRLGPDLVRAGRGAAGARPGRGAVGARERGPARAAGVAARPPPAAPLRRPRRRRPGRRHRRRRRPRRGAAGSLRAGCAGRPLAPRDLARAAAAGGGRPRAGAGTAAGAGRRAVGPPGLHLGPGRVLAAPDGRAGRRGVSG